MPALFALTAAVILYGTLFPFSIAESAHVGDILPRFVESFGHRPGRGDALSNLVLGAMLAACSVLSAACSFSEERVA